MNGEAMEGNPAQQQQQQQHAGNGSHLPPPPTITPAIPPYVKLGLTIAYTIFYSLLFAFVYAQLWLVLRYRHKRFSYQTAFLFLCLLWAALRALLFSFYFRDCVTANALGPFAFWLLYCFPVCLQFFTLSLMNLYCAQVRGRRRYRSRCWCPGDAGFELFSQPLFFSPCCRDVAVYSGVWSGHCDITGVVTGAAEHTSDRTDHTM